MPGETRSVEKSRYNALKKYTASPKKAKDVASEYGVSRKTLNGFVRRFFE